MEKQNSTFRGASPIWANACVGDNGHPGYWEYSTGYSQAANLIIKAVLDDGGIHLSVDNFIYPVCFNMRHSVELRLKGLIEQLQKIASYKKESFRFDFAKSHDISNIWGFFKTRAIDIDKRYIAFTDLLENLILDIAEIDPTGQTFRYPLSSESKKHLTDVSVINFIVLSDAFKRVESLLEKIWKLSIYLIDEYSLQTFTNNLNRSEIQIIAKTLPPKHEWKNSSFNDVLASLRASLGISNKELSKAINIIKTHYEFAPDVSENVPLKGVNEEGVLRFLDQIVERFGVLSDTEGSSIKAVPGFENFQEGLLRDQRFVEHAYKKLEPLLTVDYVAGLKALFYFARDLDFSERYLDVYDYEYRVAVIEQQDELKYRIHFMHLFNKANALYNILRSLFFLRHTELAEEVISRYELEHKLSWLDDARSRKMFRKPDFAGYQKNQTRLG